MMVTILMILIFPFAVLVKLLNNILLLGYNRGRVFLFLNIRVCAVYGHTTARFLTRTIIHGYRTRDYSPICARFKACCNSRSDGHVTALQCSYVHQYAQPGDALKWLFGAFNGMRENERRQ